MKLFNWKNKSWRERLVFIATVAVILLLSLHPELRLLVPLIDAAGLDLFLLLVGAQVWTYFSPFLLKLYDAMVLTAARKGYGVVLFFFGCAGPWADAKFRLALQRITA
ncbi:hypothetical protein HPT27_16295 [Permianibacter sp. IMCC34836]|uniref:hypothetical protein n=1 Tax=Permianibacter fluminis TaxID=2738515 RepID=UPI00155663EC|nr:hypothetical protein [Permianibacter fluminis]NQD38585.1 hypothetical protein [Permianibacter fluminis]